MDNLPDGAPRAQRAENAAEKTVGRAAGPISARVRSHRRDRLGACGYSTTLRNVFFDTRHLRVFTDVHVLPDRRSREAHREPGSDREYGCCDQAEAPEQAPQLGLHRGEQVVFGPRDRYHP